MKIKSIEHFENFVENEFINFLQLHKLEGGSIKNGIGDKATVSVDKHGFFKVKYTIVKDNL